MSPTYQNIKETLKYVETAKTSQSNGDLTELSNQLANLVKEIKELEDRWIELGELLP